MLGQFLLYTAVTAGLARLLLRRRTLAVAVTAAFVLAVACFADTRDWEWFDWAKRFSVVVPCFLIAVANRWGARPSSPAWAAAMAWMCRWGFPAILLFNIAEAVALDAAARHPANALVGLATLLTVPGAWRGGWHFDARGRLAFPAGALWVALYTVWGVAFIGLNLGGTIQNTAVAGLAVLAAAALSCAFPRDWPGWFSTRAYTLGMVIVVDSVWADAFPATLTQPPAAPVLLGCQIAGAALAVAAIAEAWRRRAGAPSPQEHAADEVRGVVVELVDRAAVPNRPQERQET